MSNERTPSSPRLSVEELAELERLWEEHMAEMERVVGPQGPAHTTTHYMRWQMAFNDARPALLAMATELVRLESLLMFLERNSGHQRGFWLPENLVAASESQGWRDPTTPKAGG